nr:phosphopantothenate synthase [Planctomycetota bacterium]
MSTILVGVSGSAACFKAVSVCSELTKRGHLVSTVLSPAAARLVRPLQFACVTGRPALSDEWQPADPGGMDHIALARIADLLVVVPATADRIGLLAHGLAPDLLGSLALAFEQDKPRLLVPAMNPEMWRHPAAGRNPPPLKNDGWRQLGPAEGL